MGKVIHSNHCEMCGLNGWPWNARSQGFARDILPISTSKHDIPTKLLSLMFYESDKSFQLMLNAWPWRMILKFKVTGFCTSSHLSKLLLCARAVEKGKV